MLIAIVLVILVLGAVYLVAQENSHPNHPR